MSNQNDELTAAERREFRKLPLEKDVPEDLERRVLNALRKKQLLSNGGHWWRSPSPAVIGLAVAASIVSLFLGIGIGRESLPAELPRASFILFLHAGPEFEPFTDANFSGRFSDYNHWVANTRASGHFITGEQLDDTGFMVRPAAPEPVIEERVLGGRDGDMLGMFLIQADDYDEAMEVALTLPHLEYGGRVAVRRVDPV